jgi:hypothetical protein
MNQLVRIDAPSLHALIPDAGDRPDIRFRVFFAGQIRTRTRDTRLAAPWGSF